MLILGVDTRNGKTFLGRAMLRYLPPWIPQRQPNANAWNGSRPTRIDDLVLATWWWSFIQHAH